MLERDILTRRSAMRALVEIMNVEPEPMGAGALARALGVAMDTAHKVRHDLIEWGLVSIEEGWVQKIPFVSLRLTPEGRTVAKLALKIEAETKKAFDAKTRRDARAAQRETGKT